MEAALCAGATNGLPSISVEIEIGVYRARRLTSSSSNSARVKLVCAISTSKSVIASSENPRSRRAGVSAASRAAPVRTATASSAARLLIFKLFLAAFSFPNNSFSRDAASDTFSLAVLAALLARSKALSRRDLRGADPLALASAGAAELERVSLTASGNAASAVPGPSIDAAGGGTTAASASCNCLVFFDIDCSVISPSLSATRTTLTRTVLKTTVARRLDFWMMSNFVRHSPVSPAVPTRRRSGF